nr:hypothetical protein [Planococcus glaciei]
MLFVLAFFIMEILVTYMIKDFIPLGDAYGMLMLLGGIVVITLYLFRVLEKSG